MTKSRNDEIYEKGVHDGQNAGLLDQFAQNIAKSLPPWTDSQEIYDKGYEYGRTHQSDRSDDKSSDSGSTGGCYVSTACAVAAGLPDDCHELSVLRSFRDGYLAARSDGQALIERYYSGAPRILAVVNSMTDATERLRLLFKDLVVPVVRLVEEGRFEAAVEVYSNAVRELELHYIQGDSK